MVDILALTFKTRAPLDPTLPPPSNDEGDGENEEMFSEFN